MIRAGRADKVRTLTDLAAQRGLSVRRYQELKPYKDKGFPAPISSDGAKTLLFDGDQVDAHLAGDPVPDLPGTDHDEDLLDRRECAALAGVRTESWNSYRARLAEHLAVVGGVEHWPRGAVLALRRTQASRPAAGGRPKRAGDQIPRDQILDLTAQLLDADPATTAARVTDTLGVHRDTAQRALTTLRAERIADHLTTHRALTPEQAAAELGYPAGQVRTATRQALTLLRGRAAAPYLAAVVEALRTAGLTDPATAPAVHYDGDTVRAAVPLAAGAPAAALVWDEETGWHTADSRRHPAASTPLLDGHTHPDPTTLLNALTN
ncbi:hypothetical protein [Streptomyces sp. NBC_00691]|uniref:hypothetical protein n=1 Tax=Streptomyces sp. NBC_00691 TaxID=2903671 RepID=UPI002E381396|nr:hypothetical protein [Streptomyces sp. NBC_00691]